MSTTANPISKTKSKTDSVYIISNPRILSVARILIGLLFFLGCATIFYNSIFVFDTYTNLEYVELQAGLSDLGITGFAFAVYFNLFFWLRAIIFLAVAALILLRRSESFIGLLVAAWMIGFGVTLSDMTSLNALQLQLFGLSVDMSNGTFNQLATVFLINLMATVGWFLLTPVLLLYPNGKVQPRWAIIPIIAYALISIAWGVIPVESIYHPTNYQYAGSAVWVVMLAAIWVRYSRYFTQLEKQQAKWLVYSFTIYILFTLIAFVIRIEFNLVEPLTSRSILGDAIGALVELGYSVIPLSIAVALFRYRLWDIDLVINRSLVFGSIFAIALATFFGVLFGLQVALGSTQPLMALIISVIVTGLLYNPVRPRVQHFVDHRIYGLRYGIDEVNRFQSESKPTVETHGSLTGERFGEYELLDLLGKGGMGEVYKAFDGVETKAIKLLNLDMSTDEDMRRRFGREAAAGMMFDHPHIVKVTSVEEQGQYYYMVMDYIEGMDLRQTLRKEGQFDVETATTILTKICDALALAHSKNYVHRDIKPANIMLRTNGDPVLMDFGIAKLRDGRTVITKTGAIGTIDYMSPEQIMEAREVDARADIYALGIVLFEMLTGERPFNGSAAQIMFAHIQQPAPDVRDLNNEIPRHIAHAIEKALAKDPNDRFQSAQDFADAISMN